MSKKTQFAAFIFLLCMSITVSQSILSGAYGSAFGTTGIAIAPALAGSPYERWKSIAVFFGIGLCIAGIAFQISGHA